MYRNLIGDKTMEKQVSYTSFRGGLAKHMEAVIEDRTVLEVTRKDHESVVVISKDDYTSMMETLYLLSNAANAEHLLDSIEQANNQEFVEVELD